MANFIEIRGLNKSFYHAKKALPALVDISLVIERQDVFGIIGLSGAGKSTLIRSLASLILPTSGEILFEGEDIAKLSGTNLRNYRRNIGMIFQHFNLLKSRTVRENIAFPLEISCTPEAEKKKRVDELLKLVGLSHKSDDYPSKLSGGEKQRVGIARALANNPRVLFCDEATSALDPKTTQEILTLLKRINKDLGVTIVLITHEMEVIKQICNKVAVIEAGKIIEQGLVSQIFFEPKDETTRQFVASGRHDIPAEFFKEASPERLLLRLHYKGKSAGEPAISDMVKRFGVNANIVLGFVDKLQDLILGTLVIELSGPKESIEKARAYLEESDIQYEVLSK